MNKLYQKNDVKFAVGESVGSLVLMDAVAQRIKNGQKVPETLFLINFAVGGLCPGAQVWLESTGQFQGRIVPALLDLLPNSPYLESLISKISEVKAGFPNIVAISCDIGSEAAASPMWLTHDKALVERARKVGFTGGGDGMFNGPGSKLIVNGKYLVDHERLALYVFKGATHKDGYDCGQFVMKELIRNGGMPNNPHHGYAEYLDYSWRLAQDPFYSKKELLTKFLLSIIEKNHRS